MGKHHTFNVIVGIILGTLAAGAIALITFFMLSSNQQLDNFNLSDYVNTDGDEETESTVEKTNTTAAGTNDVGVQDLPEEPTQKVVNTITSNESKRLRGTVTSIADSSFVMNYTVSGGSTYTLTVSYNSDETEMSKRSTTLPGAQQEAATRADITIGSIIVVDTATALPATAAEVDITASAIEILY